MLTNSNRVYFDRMLGSGLHEELIYVVCQDILGRTGKKCVDAMRYWSFEVPQGGTYEDALCFESLGTAFIFRTPHSKIPLSPYHPISLSPHLFLFYLPIPLSPRLLVFLSMDDTWPCRIGRCPQFPFNFGNEINPGLWRIYI